MDRRADGSCEWLEALIPTAPRSRSRRSRPSGFAVLVAAAAVQERQIPWSRPGRADRRRRRGSPRQADPSVVLPGQQEVSAPGVRLVHPSLAKHPKARPALEALGIQQIDAELEFELLLARLKPEEFDQDWDTIWRLGRAREAGGRACVL